MKSLILLPIVLFFVGCFATQTADQTALKKSPPPPQSYNVAVKPSKIGNSLLSEEEKNGIRLNNTKIRILLDDLVSGEAIDTTILRGATITTYSFTPQINYWDITDSSYSARYFFTIDVKQEVTPNAKFVLEKKVAEIDKQIQEEERKTAAKKQLRENLSKTQ